MNLLAGLAQIVLGVLFWSGRAYSLLTLHMMLGMLFVVALWTVTGLSVRAGVAWRWVLLAVAWGVVVVAFGAIQTTILPGPLHWLVKVTHLLLGLVAMVMAVMLARAIRRH